jgi:hypothetical protein
MDLREIGWEVVDWIHLAVVRNKSQTLVNTVINFPVPLRARNFSAISATISFSTRNLIHADSHVIFSSRNKQNATIIAVRTELQNILNFEILVYHSSTPFLIDIKVLELKSTFPPYEIENFLYFSDNRITEHPEFPDTCQ